jgi:hypothetical protein
MVTVRRRQDWDCGPKIAYASDVTCSGTTIPLMVTCEYFDTEVHVTVGTRQMSCHKFYYVRRSDDSEQLLVERYSRQFVADLKARKVANPPPARTCWVRLFEDE